MGERAVTACLLPTGQFACYRSQWCGSDETLAGVFDAESADQGVDVLERCDWTFAGEVSATELIETLDYLSIEVVYVLSETELWVCLPLWFGIENQDSRFGVLIRVDSLEAYHRLREGFTRQKQRLGDAVDRQALGWMDACWLLGYLSAHCAFSDC